MYQSVPQKPKQGFSKRSKNIFVTDNRSDEMMANVLDLYPQKNQYIFQGKEGEQRRKALLKKVRSKFNMASEEDEYMQFGKKIREKVKKGKEKIGKGLKKVGGAVKTAALAPARGAFLALTRINFRGIASRFNLLNPKGEKSLFDKWEKLGGKRDSLQKAIDAGKGKHPLACGKKCRSQAGKNPQLPTEAQSDFSNFEPTTTAALIAAGSSILTVMVKSVSDKSNYKSQIELAKLENDIAKAEDVENKVDNSMSAQEKALAEEIIKAQEGSFDAVKAITDNPNLTAEEKKAALTDLKKDLGSGKATNNKIMIAVGVLALIGVGFYLYKRNNQN